MSFLFSVTYHITPLKLLFSKSPILSNLPNLVEFFLSHSTLQQHSMQLTTLLLETSLFSLKIRHDTYLILLPALGSPLSSFYPVCKCLYSLELSSFLSLFSSSEFIIFHWSKCLVYAYYFQIYIFSPDFLF